MQDRNILLTASRLAFSYGTTRIFADVDLQIAQREIVCLIGASGCGKSTLLRLLAGLAQPTAGTISVSGPSDQSLAARSSMVFQSPALLPWLSVADNVAFGLDFACREAAPLATRKTRIEAVLAQVGLSGHARQKPQALSGGMAQRVALARALARDPAIIFLDEPFSALDAITRESMQDLLLELAHQQQSAALLVTHDIDEALRIGDRVLLLAAPQAGEPARIVGEWQPEGRTPRQHRSIQLNAMREDILNTLSNPSNAWVPDL